MKPEADDLRPPTLVAGDLKLAPLKAKYTPLLYEWESDVSSLFLWTARKAVSSETEFNEALASRLRNYYHVFFMIEDSREKPVGFIYSYDANLVDGFVFVTTFLEPSSRRNGLGAKAGVLFYDYIFSYYPLRKVYCDVFDYNKDSLDAMKNAGFEVEGTFKQHRFFKGTYHTMYRLSLYRKQFYERANPMLEKWNKR